MKKRNYNAPRLSLVLIQVEESIASGSSNSSLIDLNSGSTNWPSENLFIEEYNVSPGGSGNSDKSLFL